VAANDQRRAVAAWGTTIAHFSLMLYTGIPSVLLCVSLHVFMDAESDSNDSLVPPLAGQKNSHPIAPTIVKKRPLDAVQKRVQQKQPKNVVRSSCNSHTPGSTKSPARSTPKRTGESSSTSMAPTLGATNQVEQVVMKCVSKATTACDDENNDDSSMDEGVDSDSMSGSEDVTSSESDDVGSEYNYTRSRTQTNGLQASSSPTSDAAVQDHRTGRVQRFYLSSESKNALSNMKQLVLAISNDDNKDKLSTGSFQCVKGAIELTKNRTELSASIDSTEANHLISSTAQIASRLANGLQNAFSQTPEDVVAFRKTVSSLSDVWDELLPALDAFKVQTELQADQAAKTARMAREIYGKHIGMISTITNAVRVLKK